MATKNKKAFKFTYTKEDWVAINKATQENIDALEDYSNYSATLSGPQFIELVKSIKNIESDAGDNTESA